MVRSIWRYSHLSLAVASSLFVVLAAVTGLLLSIEPVSDQLKPYKAANFNAISLAETLGVMHQSYDEIISFTVDENDFLIASVITDGGQILEGYFNPITGEFLGEKKEKSPFFQMITSLHRSLFLKGIGRFFVGLTSFLLSLITITGLFLLVKRQGGWKRFFSKIVYENFAQFYHVYLGRISLLPIFIVSLTGVYLSMVRFELIPQEKIQHVYPKEDPAEIPKMALADLEVFKRLKLSDVKSVEFPFSEDRMDYYTVDLHHRSLLIDQYDGTIISEQPIPISSVLASISLQLHTGKGNTWWALSLGMSCVALLFFVYSGFSMSLKRKKNSKVQNNIDPDKAKYILLVGSEMGTTKAFASAFQQALINANQSVYLAFMNEFQRFEAAEQFIVFTSTYGQGEAPQSAHKFLHILSQHELPESCTFSVVGFGSYAYENYCKYAFDVHQAFLDRRLKPLLDVYTIHDKSQESFEQWVATWQQLMNLRLTLSTKDLCRTPAKLTEFEIQKKWPPSGGLEDTFLLRIKSRKSLSFHSGDLFAIHPLNDHRERLYSIGRVESGIQLSVKHHFNGMGSGYLYKLKKGEILKGRIIANPAFRFPKSAREVVMIANGTGIAPFLGMLYENKPKCKVHLYLGLKEKKSFQLYADQLNEVLKTKQLFRLVTVFSREAQNGYVQHKIAQDEKFIADILKEKGVLMICGSLNMYMGVLQCLETICQNQGLHPVNYYIEKKQIKSDCY
ncbi:PepSY domain-containing protein [Flavobacteriaceae bacterium F08102]|nr:PepSY domain-containing protein [Flavobacteriaceae bacterium F08102]